ncbi:hypothetical protein A2276_00390 [candidate division WOR-1 bacterium RIFOXYA12_FULL_43_27]|uniref:General secretion pathway GspH domain-containing protein n=1 Tax=candidate division WOR-1 bacterium RIFOXYC2_FULL_46_14 TaxID=1802587 RepID=A0A1F4U6B1_UNCSA|nr:MAG: hypothetical protein A2276_00390 [candidate division WOR-1 bacterium RIFOXYA12_FULL_43_27]OGC20846.1 MAG: hypothetical protein A2292_07485 [candidate division WOR-1 bacterium RIFOXYB2_FULL_46_45]OGC31417.1 MAG: hypothetical protein A2232_03965 [candidate division WOR-1 bacterium RIFOXYA2_FULL_46_56]OGC39823.1 MAG: hypothetical protein A2438_04800 [candidate division WOR-1 bacterium RIFOXYC2_FULL_46_14]
MRNRSRGFTLLEILIVLSLIAALFGFSYLSFSGYTDSARLNAASKLIVADLRLAQNNASSERQSYVVAFDGGSYTINSQKTVKLPQGITAAPYTFIFSPSGAPPPGGSGTLVLSGKKHSRKIIVSSEGRIRVE